jgi:transcriptional regulator with GAF, ATPase, and Fis domain
MPTDVVATNSAKLIAHALDLGRRQREKLQVAVDAFRALSSPDRLQFLALVENDIVAASSGDPAPEEAVATPAKSKASKATRKEEPSTDGKFQRQHVLEVLEQNDWNISATSRAMNLPRERLNSLIQAHQIKRGTPKQKRGGRPRANEASDEDE